MGNLLEAENLLVGAESYQFILIDWGMSGVTEKVWIQENLPKSFLYCQILKCFLYLQYIKKKKKKGNPREISIRKVLHNHGFPGTRIFKEGLDCV